VGWQRFLYLPDAAVHALDPDRARRGRAGGRGRLLDDLLADNHALVRPRSDGRRRVPVFGPLIYLDEPEKFTVALALATLVQRFGTDWKEVMAANLIVMIPVLLIYFFAQDKLIGGIANVGLKG
jgi:hypothetical protein